MNIDTILRRGDRIQSTLYPGIVELLCDPHTVPWDRLAEDMDRSEPWWSLHVRIITGTPGVDHGETGDTAIHLMQMSEIEYIARAAQPDTSCPGGHRD